MAVVVVTLMYWWKATEITSLTKKVEGVVKKYSAKEVVKG